MKSSRKIADMLDYENQMFLDILHEDGLVLTAKGLGLEDVFLSLLKVYSDPGNLVLVLGTTHHEEAFFIERLTAEGVTPLPRIITSEAGSSADRKNLYLQGGVLFLSPRILVVDLLKERLPISHMTGIMVYRAHGIMRSCQEAFAVRLYRQKNKTGFVKAFSSSAEAFTKGFCHVSRIMKTLFLKRLYLWPRFQAIVQSSLSTCKPTVVEMHVQLTPAMTRIQNAILELMAFTVKELKRINPSMDFEELTVENAIAKSFHKLLQNQLDPVWHQLSEKTKTLVSDLKILRVFLNYLTRYDCVTFNTFVSSFRTQSYALSSSGWLLLEPANVLFSAARQRVLGEEKKKKTTNGNGKKASKPSKKPEIAPVPDEDDEDADLFPSSSQRSRRGRKTAGDALLVESPVKYTKLSTKETLTVTRRGRGKRRAATPEGSGGEEEEGEGEEMPEMKETGEKKEGIDPEPSPKWLVLKQVLAEIKEVSKTSPEDSSTPDKVLVLVQDKRTAKQLQDVLLYGAREMLLRLHARSTVVAHRPGDRPQVDPHARSPTALFQRHQPRTDDDLELRLNTQMLRGEEDDPDNPDETSEEDQVSPIKSDAISGESTPVKSSSITEETTPVRGSSIIGQTTPVKSINVTGQTTPGKRNSVPEETTPGKSSRVTGESTPVKGSSVTGETTPVRGINVTGQTTPGKCSSSTVGEEQPPPEEYRDVYILSQRPTSERDDKEGGTEEGDAKYQVFADKLAELEQSCDDVSVSNADAVFQPPIVIIQTFKTDGDPLSLPRTLDEARPRFVVLYDVDVAAIRRIEVYQSVLPAVQIHVYFVVFGGSVEEQAYLTALRREKEAFEFLIREKATMVIPEDQDGRSDTCEGLLRDAGKASDTVAGGGGSRQAGGQAAAGVVEERRPTVVVDMREFNSELPAMIHRRGIEVDPVTLQIGDYVLSPDICVERKSISDLIGSLNNGRLYNQAKAMTRYYTNPMLLIEFDQNKPMTLQGNYYISKDMSSNDVSAKLILLTLHFPRLKIVWSPSPYATAQLFEELKQIREEPDPLKAAGVGADLEQDLDLAEKYNPAIHDLVARLPGVTTKNIARLLDRGQSLDHLLTLSKDKLRVLLSTPGDGDSFHDGLHKVYDPAGAAEAAKRGAGKRWKGKGGFKRPV